MMSIKPLEAEVPTEEFVVYWVLRAYAAGLHGNILVKIEIHMLIVRGNTWEMWIVTSIPIIKGTQALL